MLTRMYDTSAFASYQSPSGDSFRTGDSQAIRKRENSRDRERWTDKFVVSALSSHVALVEYVPKDGSAQNSSNKVSQIQKIIRTAQQLCTGFGRERKTWHTFWVYAMAGRKVSPMHWICKDWPAANIFSEEVVFWFLYRCRMVCVDDSA